MRVTDSSKLGNENVKRLAKDKLYIVQEKS